MCIFFYFFNGKLCVCVCVCEVGGVCVMKVMRS
jgi:hypothetical protein